MTVTNQVPTNKLETALRALYLQWLAGVPNHEADISAYIDKFETDSRMLIEKLGGQVASLGALAGFPVPSKIELSERADTVYSEMKQAAIKASIIAGINSEDAARQMLNVGLDSSFNQLKRLARTETVSAYWGNQWDSVADVNDGSDDELVMLWGAEISDKSCDYCIERDGMVVDDPTIRDHPNGRCTLIPTLRSEVDYKGTLNSDGSISQDKDWTGRSRTTTRDPKAGKRDTNISDVEEIDG